MALLNFYNLYLTLFFSAVLSMNALCYPQDTVKENKSAAIRFTNSAEASIGMGDCISYGARFSSGIQIKSKLFFGVGFGYDYYSRIDNYGGNKGDYTIEQMPSFDLQVVPVYLDIRYPFYKRNELSIYVCLGGGKSILISDNVNEVDAHFNTSLNQGGYYAKVSYKYEDGTLYYIGLGFTHAISSNTKLLYGFGFHHAGIVLTDPHNSKQMVGEYIAIRVGIGF